MSDPLRAGRGLRARMAVAALMLAVLYATLVALLAVAGLAPELVAVVAVLAFLANYLTCERMALRRLGARVVDPGRAPELHAAARRVCVAAGRPLPRLAVAPAAMPNAFTVGRTPSRATLCATRGLLDLLDDSELDAVVAHELAHVASRDVMVMTMASPFASVAALLTRVHSPRRADRHRPHGGRRTPDARDGPPFAAVVASGLVHMLFYLVVAPLTRRRELDADRGAALLTGDPGALAAALEQISDEIAAMGDPERHGACAELSAFYVIGPDVRTSVATMCPTHPDLRERCEALARLWPAARAGV